MITYTVANRTYLYGEIIPGHVIL